MKKIFCSVVSFLVFSLFVPKGLFPQALESSVSETKASDSQKYIQRIEWEGDENAWQYGIEIISEDASVEPLTLTTEATFVTFTLPPGNYKYRISVYDLFGHIAVQSKWCVFTITKAVQPIIGDIEENITVKKSNKVEIPVQLENVSDASKIVMINSETNEEVVAEFEVETDKDTGINIVDKLIVPKLPEGNWTVKVTNPGGKSIVSDNININLKKKDYDFKNVNFQLQGGYPFLFGNSDVLSFLDSLVKFNLGGRFSIAPINFGRNYFGFDVSYNFDDIIYQNQLLTIAVNLHTVQFSVLYQFELWEEHLYFDTRLGMGVTFMDLFSSGGHGDDFEKGYIYPAVNGSLAFMYRPVRHMNIELGAQAIALLTPDNIFVIATPVLLVGVSF